MCTVTVLRVGDMLRLVCNRDESRQRPSAYSPLITLAGRLHALMPQDPAGRGTWIAANSAGLVFAILNTYPETPRIESDPHRISRGLIIPSLLECAMLLTLELKIPSHGLLTVGGLASLIFGSMILMDSSVPELQLSLRFVLPIAVGLAAVAAFLVRLSVAAQRLASVSGVAGMIGETGEAMTAIEPGRTGRVMTHGEIWTATAAEPIAEGDRIRVTSVDGLTLTVRKS